MTIDWSTAAQGGRVVPLLLIHGAPWAFVPEGVAVSSVSWSTTPDPLFWPDDTGAFTAVARPWIDLVNGIAWSERLQPTAPSMLDVGAITITLSDRDDQASTLFSVGDLVTGTFLTQEVTASDTTIYVASTSGFGSSGTLYLDREAVIYGGKTGTTFTSCTRGEYGSTATRHAYSASAGAGLGNSEARDLVGDVTGYTATVWWAELSAAGVLVNVELAFVGHLGAGVTLAEDREGWVLPIDHAVKRLDQPLRSQPLLVAGYAHPGNLGARTSTPAGRGARLPDFLSPAQLHFYTNAGGTTALVMLTGDTGTLDRGGWHPTREAFVRDLDQAGRAAVYAVNPADTFSAALTSGGLLAVSANFSAIQHLSGYVPWNQRPDIGTTIGGASATFAFTLETPMPEAWIPIYPGATVYLSDSDYAAVPSVPVLDAAAADTHTQATYCLAIDGPAGEVPRYAAIEARASSGGINTLTVTPLVTSRSRENLERWAGLAALRRAGTAGYVIDRPTNVRLALHVVSDSWVAALRYAVVAVNDAMADGVADVFDWDDIARTVSARTSPAGGAREYVIDLADSILSVVVNEALLNGYALALKAGRVTFVRVAEFATTETTLATLTTADLVRDAPKPGYEIASDGIVNAFELMFNDGSKVPYVDQTSVRRYGAGRSVLRARWPEGTLRTATAAALYMSVVAVALQTLGPHRYPYRHVTVTCGLHMLGLATGALVTLSAWRVPTQAGTRGVTDVIAQVVGRAPTVYEGASHVRLILRLNPSYVAGYAPAALVAAGGIAGAVVTCDTTSVFGAGGFAQSGTDGGAATFAVGDLVRLVELDASSPTASTQHAVTAVSGATITLSPAPSATFGTLAAAALKVMVVFDNWDVVVASQQEGWCYLAESDGTLDGDRARRYAA